MVKKLPILFALSLLSFGGFAQLQKQFGDLLATQDFRKLQPFCDNLPQKNYPKKGETIESYWAYLRDLAPGFREGVFSLTTYSRNAERRMYKINVLVAADTQIISYSFIHLISLENGESGRNFDTAFKFVNDTLCKRMSEVFKTTFGVPLNKKELFIDSISYGSSCGCAGIRPLARQITDRWVSYADTIHLTQWLLSPNTEKQLYALDGFNRLKKKGILPSSQSLRVIQYIMYKKGSVLNCSMCNYSHTEIGTITVGFNF
jgi:hypothetical protein